MAGDILRLKLNNYTSNAVVDTARSQSIRFTIEGDIPNELMRSLQNTYPYCPNCGIQGSGYSYESKEFTCEICGWAGKIETINPHDKRGDND